MHVEIIIFQDSIYILTLMLIKIVQDIFFEEINKQLAWHIKLFSQIMCVFLLRRNLYFGIKNKNKNYIEKPIWSNMIKYLQACI